MQMSIEIQLQETFLGGILLLNTENGEIPSRSAQYLVSKRV